jgi:TPR repeat protein
MPVRLAALCVLHLLLSANAIAQEAPVTDCDTYGASPGDSQRKVLGVPYHKLDPAVAIPACEDAVRRYPAIDRFHFQLGRAYLKASNFTAAAVHFRKAADGNHALAQYNLGFLYENGRGVPRDDRQAVVWLRKSADQGVATAQLNLGLMYKDGRGVPKDEREAIVWLRKAADQRDAKAQYNLGVMYANGQGVPQSYEEGVVWFRKAADGGIVAAWISLGVMYARGQGVPKDEQQAIFWYRKAADLGDTRAKAMLEELQAAQGANRGR